MLTKYFFLVLITLLIGYKTIRPQSPDSLEHKWSIRIEPYFQFASMQGKIGIGALPEAELDANPSDLLGKLKFAFMLFHEVHNEEWALGSDLMYISLQEDIKNSQHINDGNAEIRQVLWELFAMYRVLDWLELGLGGRLMNINSELSLNVIRPNNEIVYSSEEQNQTWFDPIVIVRAKTSANKNWLFEFRGDVGGFGISSKITWQLFGAAGYRFSQLFELFVDYRIIGIDYEQNSGEDNFIYDVNIFGPEIRLRFNL